MFIPRRNYLDTTDVLTDEEVDKLPLNLRCCFHIQPWSRTFEPKNVAEWAYAVGWVLFRYNEGGELIDRVEAAKRSVTEVDRLWEFTLREYCMLVAHEIDKMVADNEITGWEMQTNETNENEIEKD